MDHSKLIRGNRYTFHYKRQNEEARSFRADYVGMNNYTNYLGKCYQTIVLENYYNTSWAFNPLEVWYMEYNLIAKIESLADIINGKTKLPDDVLHIIDGYL